MSFYYSFQVSHLSTLKSVPVYLLQTPNRPEVSRNVLHRGTLAPLHTETKRREQEGIGPNLTSGQDSLTPSETELSHSSLLPYFEPIELTLNSHIFIFSFFVLGTSLWNVDNDVYFPKFYSSMFLRVWSR